MSERAKRQARALNGTYILSEVIRIAGLLASDYKAGYRRIQRGVGVLRAAVLFRGCERGELVNAQGSVRVIAEGKIRLGDRVQLVLLLAFMRRM